MTPEEREIIDATLAWMNHPTEYGSARSRVIDAVEAYWRINPESTGDEPMWEPATFADCLRNDRIRLDGEEATVLRSTRGTWHADSRDEWRPKAWQHIEVRLELDIVPGLQPYPPNQEIEILMTSERKAVHLMSRAFPGSIVIDGSDTRV